jgi:hypothetical protein
MHTITPGEWVKNEELQKRLDDLLKEVSEAGMELQFHSSKEQVDFMLEYFKSLPPGEGGTLSFRGIEKQPPLRLHIDFIVGGCLVFSGDIREAHARKREIVRALKRTAKEKT